MLKFKRLVYDGCGNVVVKIVVDLVDVVVKLGGFE